MKRIDKLMLCSLMVCALAVPASGEEPVQETGTSTSAPTQAVTQAPESTATTEVSAAPSQSAEAEVSAAPSQPPDVQPGQSSEPEVSAAPSQPPDVQPSQSAEPGVSAEPSQQPSQSPDDGEPTAEPGETAEPSQPPLPGSIDGLVQIVPEGTAQQENGIWRIQLSAPDASLAFTWTVSAEATGYLVYVQSEAGELRLLAETGEGRIALAATAYMTGQHTLYVGAILTDGSVTWGCITFALAGQGGGGHGGAFPGGGRTGGSAGQLPQEEQGFHVTPGEALSSSHASGTKDTTAYACSEIPASTEAMTALLLDSTQTEIALDGGAAFYVSEENAVLQLIPESDGACWQLNALALKTLAESGVERVVFHLGERSWELSTRMEFGGSAYAALRAAGYVSKDMELRIDEQGLRVEIAGAIYGIDANGALVPDGE